MTQHETKKEEAKKNSTTATVNKLGIEEKLDEARLLEHPSYIELQNKLSDAEEKATKNWDIALRTKAEMENLHRRVERDIANAHKYSLEKFVNELVPVVDNLERALEHSPEDEGINLTLKSLIDALQKFGVEQVNPLNQPFNPEFHQAVSTQALPDVKPGTVVAVFQKGYLLNGRLVRPALVVVSQ